MFCSLSLSLSLCVCVCVCVCVCAVFSSVSVSEGDYIVSMSLSPSEETLVCATASQQILIHTLSSTDLTKVHTFFSPAMQV